MKADRIITLGAVGAVACVGACVLAAFIPAALATGGLAFVAGEFLGWPAAVGFALFVAAGLVYWRARTRRVQQQQTSCGCVAGDVKS